MVAIYFGLLAGAALLKLKKWEGNAAILLLILLFTTKEISIFQSQSNIKWNRKEKINWVNCYLEEKNIEQCDQKTKYKLYPNSFMIEEKLKFLEENNLNFFVEHDKHRTKQTDNL